jgi:hypothetical protein
VAEEPADLPALIGCRIFIYEFMSHSKFTAYLTYVRRVCAQDYTGEMASPVLNDLPGYRLVRDARGDDGR